VVAGAATFYLVVLSPPTFNAQLQQVGKEWLVPASSVFYGVNLSLTFASPASLDPANLTITLLFSHACDVPLAGKNLTSVDLTYNTAFLPRWTVVRNYSLWSGLLATATNPDGKMVGWAPPVYTNFDKTVESGAVLFVAFLGSYRGLLQGVRVAYAGYAGTAEVTLA
jgi:hypothetical protein